MTRSVATVAQIKRVIAGAKAAGLKVGAVEVKTDGTIRLVPATPEPAATGEDVDDWFNGRDSGQDKPRGHP